ncbi:MAG: bifunctional glutamate N-acetyltransferase/amino-acid acetyltransferase ArgJ [Acidimicrobiia bacterium]|nr:bifunctional glutamate N-acetyltransferase/amino-acid acetyltransferase ArgJ [Acidimicrobiia bacterium]
MSVTAAMGFAAGGSACGIKAGGGPDLAIVTTETRGPVPAAGVFTLNLAQAAPVQVSRKHLHDAHATAVVLSSGNANAATGEQGRADALRMAELTALGLGCDTTDVLVCSTGLIGYPMPMYALESGIPVLAAKLNGSTAAANAILTTDSVSKEAVVSIEGTNAVIGGMAKGAAMLMPSMATMLAVLTTDAEVDPSTLQTALTRAVDLSFNQLCVDACTSTNDTVLVLASGASGAGITNRNEFHALTDALTEVCSSLAEQMARDAEGASKLARITIRGARSDSQARLAARSVARSQLVQCSLNGEDPYWGRVLSELGVSGAIFDPESVDISFNGIVCCRNGIAAAHDAVALAGAMTERDIHIECTLNAGNGRASVLFTDLSHAYIDENRGTS